MAKKAILFLAEGFEEVEAITPVDYLRRAGVEVVTAAITPNRTVRGAHGIAVCADTDTGALAKEGKLSAAAWDAVIIPGGQPGANNLAACKTVGRLYLEMAAAGKITAAICASPAVVLAPLGLLDGKNFTCFPGAEKQVKAGTWSADKVVVDGNLITSRAPGTAAGFALALIEKLAGADEVDKLKAAALLH
ncbi:MAG: DJ-1/PfpI family protein [Treponema sp.]|jgi:4-methyl-5(b-hydroxyethyl)-thiazole monophosphate biosynthesis|nr:DJ-1/PfpI family protein [Treponema sp.]